MNPVFIVFRRGTIPSCKNRLAIGCGLALASGCLPAMATSEYWTGTINGYSWAYNANWSGSSGLAPSSTGIVQDPFGSGTISSTQSLDSIYDLASIEFESDTVQHVQANHSTGGTYQVLELEGDASGNLMVVTDMPSAGLAIGDQWSFGTVYTELDSVGNVNVTATSAPFLAIRPSYWKRRNY